MPKRHLSCLALCLASVFATAGTAAATPAQPTGRHLYASAETGSGPEVLPFDVLADGSLAQRNDQAFPITASSEAPRQIVISRDARTLYVALADSLDMNTFQLVPGEVDVLAVAADGSLSLVQRTSGGVERLAITPDGARLFARTSGSDVVSYPVAADGTLGSASAATVVADGGAYTLAVSPDSRTLWVASTFGPLHQYAIGVAGALTPRSPATVNGSTCRLSFLEISQPTNTLDAVCGTASNTGFVYGIGSDGVLHTPSSSFATTADQFATVSDVRGRALYDALHGGGLMQWQRASDGSLTLFPTSSVASPQPDSIGVDPSGNTLVISDGGRISEYPIAADGSLGATAVALSTGMQQIFDLAYAPDQPPVAALTGTASGLTATFDARASHAVDGTVARYAWDFGDGTTLVGGDSTPSHTYARAGDYTASVTLTDSLGCSDTASFKGMGWICAGLASARASATVHVVAAPVVVVAPPVDDQPAVPASVAPTAPTPAPIDRTPPVAADPGRLSASQTTRGGTVLSWQQPADASTATRYLVLWSVERSAHGANDRIVRHRVWTTSTRFVVPRSAAHTLHVAVYAYHAGTALRRVVKTTLRLKR